MITPEEIRVKAERLYPQVVNAWLEGEQIFPRALPANLKPAPTYAEAFSEQQALRNASKDKVGYGYSLRLNESVSRRHSKQNFVAAVFFETREDLLKLIGKMQEFRCLVRAVERVRARQPRLDPWLRKHWGRLLDIETSLSGLLDVVEYLQSRPRPNCFLRELPIAVSTKLIEEHSPLLAEWLDILIPEAVDFGFSRKQFALRYGFRSPDDQLLFRILDPSMLAELQCPGTEISLPLTTLVDMFVRDAQVIIVENKVNLLTLPCIPRTVALGGLGNGVSRLFGIPWLRNLPLAYWGDIDLEGLQILAGVRHQWPHVRSVMMDRQTLEQFHDLRIPGNPCSPDLTPPDRLTIDEQAAFVACRDGRLRLEQERIPQALASERLMSVFGSGL